jgi:hypothetical protein
LHSIRQAHEESEALAARRIRADAPLAFGASEKFFADFLKFSI